MNMFGVLIVMVRLVEVCSRSFQNTAWKEKVRAFFQLIDLWHTAEIPDLFLYKLGSQ
jgi:hypothetical protein